MFRWALSSSNVRFCLLCIYDGSLKWKVSIYSKAYIPIFLSIFLAHGKVIQCFITLTPWKVSKYGVFSGPYSDWIRRFTVNLRIQSEYRKIQTRKNSVFGHFTQWLLPRLSYIYWLINFNVSIDKKLNAICIFANLCYILFSLWFKFYSAWFYVLSKCT